MRIRTVVPPLLLSLTTACASSFERARPIPVGWLSAPESARVVALSFEASGRLLYAPPPARQTDVRIVKTAAGEKLARGDRELTPEFRAIDSFDVSDERREVVFSAKRNDNFDIGLVSIDGSEVHWVPEDPADETSVQWAPRGNKVSFVVHTKTGDLVRTVHIPTATQLTVDFPYARIRALAWEPGAERYAVAYDSIDVSSSVESLRYDGEGRRLVAAPSVRLDDAIEWAGGALLLRPSTLRYNEKLPLVVWPASDPLAWDDARGDLLRRARVACAVMSGVPDEAFWSAMRELPWIDPGRVFVVRDGTAVGESAARETVVGGGDVPPGHYVVRGNVVLTAPAVVKSFAARYIADQLKGSSPPHGHSW